MRPLSEAEKFQREWESFIERDAHRLGFAKGASFGVFVGIAIMALVHWITHV